MENLIFLLRAFTNHFVKDGRRRFHYLNLSFGFAKGGSTTANASPFYFGLIANETRPHFEAVAFIMVANGAITNYVRDCSFVHTRKQSDSCDSVKPFV